jgi:hypothetical protein
MEFIIHCFALYGAYLIIQDLFESKKCDCSCDDEDYYHE